jgi:hypothetical protein
VTQTLAETALAAYRALTGSAPAPAPQEETDQDLLTFVAAAKVRRERLFSGALVWDAAAGCWRHSLLLGRIPARSAGAVVEDGVVRALLPGNPGVVRFVANQQVAVPRATGMRQWRRIGVNALAPTPRHAHPDAVALVRAAALFVDAVEAARTKPSGPAAVAADPEVRRRAAELRSCSRTFSAVHQRRQRGAAPVARLAPSKWFTEPGL